MSEIESMSGAHDCGGDVAAYVLGAMEPDEAEVFRAHLEHCAICRDELEALGGVVQALPMAAPQYPAPAGLQKRLMHEIQRDAKARRAQNPLQRRRRSLPLWLTPRVGIASLGSALVAAAAVVTGLELSAGAAGTLIQAQVSGVKGTAQLRVVNDHGELIVRHMTSPGRGKVYEVWVRRGDSEPVPASVLFSVNSSGSADVSLPNSLRGDDAVMVTPEPLGGTSVPTHSPVVVAKLD